jgi:hypothetical protein
VKGQKIGFAFNQDPPLPLGFLNSFIYYSFSIFFYHLCKESTESQGRIASRTAGIGLLGQDSKERPSGQDR